MAIDSPPIITLAGVELAGAWDGSRLAALDRLRIVWGRDSLYSSPNPSKLNMSIIDPTGEWVTAEDLIGRELLVERLVAPSERKIVARLRITDHTVDRARIIDPRTNKPVTVWRADLTATDPRAVLEQWQPTVYVPRWSQTVRLEAMMQNAVGIVSSIERAPAHHSGRGWWFNGHESRTELKDAAPLMETIERAYRTMPMGHANYNAETNGIEIGLPAAFNGLHLVYAGGRLAMAAAAAGTTIVPANRFGVPNGYTLTADTDSSIDEIGVGHSRAEVDPETGAVTEHPYDSPDFTPYRRTAQYSPTVRGLRRLKVKADMFYANTASSAGAFPNDPKVGAAEIAADWVAAVNKVNGGFKMPTIRFDFRRRASTGSSTLNDQLLTIRDHPLAIYFEGSVFNVLNAVGPAFQIIGGTLEWAAGWVHDLTLGPAMTNPLATLTVNQLVTNTEPTMADYADTITLADLGHVTKGAE